MSLDKNENEYLSESLTTQENLLDEINEKIKVVLDKREVVSKEYDELVDNKVLMEKKEIKKNKKYIALGKISVMISSLVKILAGGILIVLVAKVLEFFKILLSLYCYASGLSLVLVGGYQLSSFMKAISNEEDLRKDLEKSLDYRNLLEQIKEREKDIKYLNMEYETLTYERDDVELELDSLMAVTFNGDKSETEVMVNSDIPNEYQEQKPSIKRRTRRRNGDEIKKGEF